MYLSRYRFKNITIELNTDLHDYHVFVQNYLANFIVEDHQDNITLSIESIFNKNTITYNQDPFSDTRTSYGKNVQIEDNQLVYKEGDWTIHLELKNNQNLNLKCFDAQFLLWRKTKNDNFLIEVLKTFKRLLKSSLKDTKHLFQKHLRLTFHFPLFWLLETRYNMHLLHGSAIKAHDYGIVFCGLADVGKSTIATYLNQTIPDIDILTDNFLLYNSKSIHAFQEMSRIDSNSFSIIGGNKNKVQKRFSIKGREYWVPQKVQEEVEPKKAFIVSLGSEFKVEPITILQFIEMAISMNDIVREFHNYNYIGLMPVLTKYSESVYLSRYRVLENCLQGCACALLTIPRTNNLGSYHEEIIKTILK